MHHAYFNKAQNMWVLFYTNPPGRRAIFSSVTNVRVWNDSSDWILAQVATNGVRRHSCANQFGGIIVFALTISAFLLHIKGFDVRQETYSFYLFYIESWVGKANSGRYVWALNLNKKHILQSIMGLDTENRLQLRDKPNKMGTN